MRKLFAVLGLVLGLLAAAMMAACNVGLGESVDTEAPTLEISYPPIAATIRDKFILYGTWDDDKGVSKVVVEVINTETKKSLGTFSATVNSNKTWQVELNEFDSEFKYKDGSYQVSVTAYDEAGHSSGESSRTFDIDNTPPVFVISNPGVVKSDNLDASAYGSLFTIDGTIADDHTISLMDVAIYDEGGNLLSHETYDSEQIDFFREEEIATAGGTSVTIAQFAEDPTTTANSRYSDVYGTDSKAGTKNYYASVTLTDSAKVYQNPTGSERAAAEQKSDSLGNSTSSVYLYDDVYTTLMSAKKGLGLSAADLKNILNGNSTNDEALALLNEKVKETAASEDNRLFFSLNPEANPTYTISGYAFNFDDKDSNQSASNGNTVNVTINSGLDGVKVDPSTMKVWMLTCDSYPAKSDVATKISSLASKVKTAEQNAKADGESTITSSQVAEIESDGWTLVYDYYTYNGSTVDVKSIAITLPSSGIVLNKYYILAVTGYDADDVEFSQNTIYGFSGNEAGIAPTINITNPGNGDFVKASELVFSGNGTVNSDSLFVSELTATITAYNGSVSCGNESGYPVTLTFDKTLGAWSSTNADAFYIDGENTTGKNFAWAFNPSGIDGFLDATASATKYTLSVYGKSSSGHDITMTTMVQLDTTDPVVKITTITPTVSGSDVSDVVKTWSGHSENNVYINGTIRIMGSIVEQNLSAVTYDIRVSDNMDADLSESRYSILEQLYNATKNNPNIPAAYDGNLGSSNSIDVNFMTSMVTSGYHNSNPSSNSDTPLKIRVIITATDKVGNVGTYSSNEYNDGKDFIIYQETDRPIITFTNADESVDSENGIDVDTNLFLTTSNKLSVTLSDDDGVETYKITVKNLNGNELDESQSTTPSKSFTSKSVSLSLPSDEGVYKVQVESSDVNHSVAGLNSSGAYGLATSKEFYVAVDSGAPTLSVGTINPYVSTADKISGTISPSTKSFENGSSITAVFVDSNYTELDSQPATLTATKNGTAWEFPLSSMPAGTSQSYILKITVEDKYHQKSSTNVSFSMDPNAPTIDATNFTAQTVNLDESSYVTLKANAYDEEDGSGIATFGYYLSTSETAPTNYGDVTWNAMNQTNSGWNVTFDISSSLSSLGITSDGTVYAFLAAKDNAGNTTIHSTPATLTIDKTAPAISVTGFDGNSVSANGTATTNVSTKTFNVEVTDTNLSSLVSDNSSVTVGTGSSSGSVTTYPVTVTWTTDSNGNVEDSKTVTFTAKDANNRETTQAVTIKCDNKAPAVTLGSTNQYYTSAPLLSGTISDTNLTGTSSDISVYLVNTAGSSVVKEGAVTINGTLWSSAFSGVDAGTYGIVIVAADTFGNKSAYKTSSVSVPSSASFSGTPVALSANEITIDATAPELSGSVYVGTSENPTETVDSSFYTNGSASIYIKVKVSDETGGSGIDTSKVWILPYSKVTSDTATTAIKATVDENGNFTFTLSSSSITKSGNVYIRVADKAGNITDTSLFAITFDNTVPKIQSATLSGTKVTGTESYTAYKSGTDESGNDKYFVNTTSGNTFSVSGIATDNLGLAKLELSVNGTNVTQPNAITDENSLSEWNFENVVLASDSTTATLTLTDKAGNTAEKTIALVSDVTAPNGIHDTDAMGKDLTFRIGDAANGNITDVGSKYSSGTYGNSTTIKIRGNFKEAGSGTSLIYYKLFNDTIPTSDEITAFSNNPEDKKTGYFSPLSSKETKTVSKNTSSDGSTSENVSVESTFKTNISGFAEGKNYLVLLAVDNVGNKNLDTVTFTPEGGTALTGCYSINVDTKTPTVKGENGTALTNGAGEGDDAYITFTGTATDAASGIKSVSVSVTINEEDKDVSDVTVEAATGDDNTENDSNKKKWTAKIPKSLFSSISSGNCPVYATAIDNAGEGNKQTVSVGQISVDKVLPRVKLNSISDAYSSTENDDTEINGTIALSGTVEDENTLRENGENDVSNTVTAIRYAQVSSSEDSAPANNSASWQKLDGLSITGNYSFKVAGFDTTELADEKYYYIQAVAVDKAGNEGYSEAKRVKVSQATDRPIVKVTNLTKNDVSGEYFLKYGTDAQISGSISDDDATSDAVVAEFIASSSAITLGSDGKIDSSFVTGTTKFTKSTGEWTFTPANTEDGSKEVYFYAEDNNGKVVYTGCTLLLNSKNTTVTARPYFQYKTSDKEESATNLTYKSDSKSPQVSATTESDSGTDADGKAASSSGNALLSSYVVGGTKKQNISFVITVTDASGIAGVTADLSYVANGTTTYFKQIATGYTNQAGEAWTSGDKYIGDLKIDYAYTLDSTSFNQTTTGDDTSWTWTTTAVDISAVPTGSLTLNVTPYDKAGLTGNQSYTFSVDNTGPTVSVTSPATNEECTGDITIKGTATDTGSAGAYNIQWIVPNDTERTAAEGKTTDADKVSYCKTLAWNGGMDSIASDSSVSLWTFNFDGSFDKATSTPAEYIYKAGNPLFTEFDKAQFAMNDDYATTELYNLPVYFMATDELGNVGVYTDFSIKHNPDWDKPKLEFTYPTTANYKSATDKYAVLGGTIRATGSAEIPSGTTTVKAIYYQIADSTGAFTGDAAASTSGTDSYNAKNKYNYEVVSAYDVINEILGSNTYSASSAISDEQLKKFGFASKAALDAWWGIEATGTASWNIKLNSNGELNPESGTTNNITIRACGVNAEGKFGAWTTGDNVIAIHVDNTAPVISSAVNQYANGTSAIAAVPTDAYTSSQTYEDDMYLRGNWTLVATLLDETSVTGYSVLKGGSALTAGTGYFVENDVSDTSISKTGVRLYIPIPKTEDSVEITVNANDADHTSTQVFKFNIDEKAPTLDSIKANGTLTDSENFTSIEDSDYQFVLSGASTDEGSGVEHVLFYYMRKGGTTQETIGTNVVMDPMITTSTDDSKVSMSSLASREFAQGTEKFYLYAKKYSGTATTDTFTSGTAYDAHVRVGGVVEIDGILHRISKIDGNTVTFTPSLAAAKTTSFDAYFPIAQVIDNSATEKVKSSSGKKFVFEKGDDDDGMPESFSKSGKTWTWDATIHTTNMSDGPASLVILAFDEAGNVAGKTINTKITNNAPRLAKVFLGTDLSGDGKYTNSSSMTEIVEYNILGAEGNTQSSYTLDFNEKLADETAKYPAGVFKIKNGLAVIPELTGGNGNIGMVLSTGATSEDAVTGTVTAAVSSGTNGTDEDGNKTTDVSFTGDVSGTFEGSNVNYKMHAFTVASDKLGTDGTDKGMSFTFWDSTEETTQGTNSQNSVLYVKNFTVAQRDSTPPTVVVNPFYWNSLNSNSIYGSADTETVSSVSDLSGHIELESDWKNATGYKADDTTGQYDGDPKVSGKITFTGTAYDDARLASLTVQFGTFLSTAVNGSTYDSANGSWSDAEATMDSDGYEFHVTDATGTDVGNYKDSVYFGQKGHKVYWTLSIDTSKISTVAEKDVSLTVIAIDHKGNPTVTTAVKPDTTDGYKVTDGTTNVPTYQMDVVPYITGVETKLSKLKSNNPSVYARTAKGHYPVQYVNSSSTTTKNYAGETIKITGFNISSEGNTVNKTVGTDITTSGEFSITVNEIESLNNKNYTDAKGSNTGTTTSRTGSYSVYNNYYNRQPNNDSNNLLTDDVYFDVWQINSAAAVVKQSGYITEPIMKINPKNNMIGFAFNNGPAYFSMANGQTTSYSWWQRNYARNTTTAFAIDENGVTHGITVGIDTNPNSNDGGRMTYMTSKWGTGSTNTQDGNYNGYRTSRIESIGAPAGTYNGTKFDAAVILEDRFSSPSLTTTVHGTSTYVFLAYYDDLNGQIRFRYGDLSKAEVKSHFGETGYSFDQFADQVLNGAEETWGNNRWNGNNDVFESKADYYSVIASNTINDNNAKAGSYVSIAAIKGSNSANDVIVATWYDSQNNKWWYSYKKNPCNDSDMSTTHSDGYWAKPIELKSEAGENCQIAVDKKGGIHIASYDVTNADLLYAYLSSYDDTTPSVCTVDSYAFTGTNLMLDTAISSDGKYVVPYISYYMSSTQKPKMAYLEKVISASDTKSVREAVTISDGVDTDAFTNTWESTIVPTSSRYADNYSYSYVNVAVWKDSDGKITAPTAAQSSSNTPYVNGDTGYCYGNGTSNPIMGYGIRVGTKGYIETAQMQ
ncbi:MAG: hypothetical protein K6B43_05605 [Treponema sp.]|nr:hypothetical protein [Treponema sp.]